jgi:hypothetical protein
MVGILPTNRLVKEAQSLIAFSIYERTYHGNKNMQKKDLEADMGVRYHGIPGDTDSIGELEKCLRGEGVLAGISLPDESISLPDESSTAREMVVHPFLTRCAGLVVIGTSLPMDHLERSTQAGSNLVAGRSLYAKAEHVAKECRKALVFVQEYLKKGNGGLHSGHTIEDYLEFVLNNMRVIERKKLKEKAAKAAKATKKKPVVASVGGDDLSDDDKEVEEEDEDAADEGNEGGNGESAGKCLPCDKSDWFFDGFWTFYVYGPYLNRRKCTVLGTGDLDAPKGTLSRAYARKEDASGGTSTRTKPPSPAKQAVEAQLSMSMASYAAQVSMEKGCDADRDIAYLTNQIELV